MALSHFFKFVLPLSPARPVFLALGSFTCGVMCYFLAEGYEHTSSVRKYALRLFLFAIISEYPFEYLHGRGFNMMFTLLISLLLLVSKDRIRNTALKFVSVIILLILCVRCDWALFAPLLVILIHCSSCEKILSSISIFLVAVLYSIYTKSFDGAGMIAAAAVIAFLYNGKPGKNSAGMKYFFYAFYPLHLALISLLTAVPVV